MKVNVNKYIYINRYESKIKIHSKKEYFHIFECLYIITFIHIEIC